MNSSLTVSVATEGEVKDWVAHRDSRVVELYRQLGQDDSRRKLERLDILKNRQRENPE